MPSKVAASLDSIFRRFLWKGSSENKGMHLVKWDVTSRPIEEGGVGITQNRKTVSFLQNVFGDTLRRRVIDAKYGLSESFYRPDNRSMTKARGPWKSILKHQNQIYDRLLYKAGNGRKISFWKDPWLSDEPLHRKFPLLFSLTMEKSSIIKSFWNNEYISWNLKLHRNLKEEEIEEWAGLSHNLSNFQFNSAED